MQHRATTLCTRRLPDAARETPFWCEACRSGPPRRRGQQLCDRRRAVGWSHSWIDDRRDWRLTCASSSRCRIDGVEVMFQPWARGAAKFDLYTAFDASGRALPRAGSPRSAPHPPRSTSKRSVKRIVSPTTMSPAASTENCSAARRGTSPCGSEAVDACVSTLGGPP